MTPPLHFVINPSELPANHAASGYRLVQLSRLVNVLGASFHAPWHFGFAPRDAHRALPVVGLSLVEATQGTCPSEVTEIQTGNTYHAGRSPLGATQGYIAVATWHRSWQALRVTGRCFIRGTRISRPASGAFWTTAMVSASVPWL